MDSYQFIPFFIQMLKYNINTPFSSYKHLLLQNDGDLVVRQQVKVKTSLGHYATNVFSPIIPIAACEFLLENHRTFSSPIFYQGCFHKLIFTNKGNSFVTSFTFEDPLSKAKPKL